jgi:hypothetical protein
MSGGIVALALTSEDMKIVACALNMLRPLLPLDHNLEEALEKRMSVLVARGYAAERPDLAEAVAHFLYSRARQQASAVVPFVPALLSFLDLDLATTGAHSYYTLMILAEDTPDDLLPFTDALIGKLASPGYAVRTLAVRIIAVLAEKRPGSMASARDSLREVVETCEDGVLKTEARKVLLSIEGYSHSTADDGTIAGQAEAVACSGQPSGNNFIHMILARLMNLWRVISRSGGDRKKKRMINDDLQEITLWIKEEFPANGEVPIAKNVWALPEEPLSFFSSKISAEELIQIAVMPFSAIPDRQVAAKQQSRENAQPVNESDPRSIYSSDEADMAGLREIIAEVENDFSVKASQILDALGMAHLKQVGKDEAGDRTISAREFKLALEKILSRQEGKSPSASPPHPRQDNRSSRPEAKNLLGEVGRNIDDSLITAREPAKSIAEKFMKPPEGRRSVDNKRPDSGGHPAKRRVSFNVYHTKKDGKIYRHYDR